MNIVHFAVSVNGVLTKKDSVSLATTPVSMAVSPDGNTLYVRFLEPPTATLSAYSLYFRGTGLRCQPGQPR